MNPSPPHVDPWLFCDRILVDVSRSFALIIPRCPPPIDRCMCVGYLLCRIADTVEDDERLTSEQRDTLYDAFLACVDSPGEAARCDRFIRAWPAITDDAYGELIRGTGAVLQAFATLPEPYRPALVTCVHDMVAGMRSMRPLTTDHGLQFYCATLADLDRYCHYVAGTVGVMSTALFARFIQEDSGSPDADVAAIHQTPAFSPDPAWQEQGRRMGLGLQMTNIIKDACTDAGRGVSFIPPQFVDTRGGTPVLTRPGRAELIRHTLSHLDEAIAYTTALPQDQIGIRTFLLGSILPAVATLEIAAGADISFPKIDRATMQALLAFVEASAHDNDNIRAFYDHYRSRCLALLDV